MSRFALSLTLDVEQCSNFPYWSSVWDHRKGAIEPDTRRYIEKLAGIAAAARLRFQWFALGISLEDPDVSYLRSLVAAGHPVGNHTYRHVNVKAQTREQLQVTYRNDPALGRPFATPLEAVRHEIRRTAEAMRERLGAGPQGFRTPGGFGNGLADVPAVQALLREEGYAYASSHYLYPVSARPRPSWEELVGALCWSIEHLQPYRYPNGLPEIPMMGISDIWAFRVLDLEREQWIRLLEAGVDHAAERGLTFSILMHPHVLACRDPHAATIQRLLERAAARGGRIVTNDELAADPVAIRG